MSDIQPIAARNVDRAAWTKEKAINAIKGIFPIASTKYTVSISNIIASDKLYGISDQKKAILEGKTLTEPIMADLTITDNVTKKVVEKITRTKLADIPFITNRSTMILEGNDYALVNQLRLKPGIYSRKRENQIIEAFFNLEVGRNFRMIMDPSTGIFYLEMDNAKIELYPILKAFGVTDGELTPAWGKELVQKNFDKTNGREATAISKLYAKLFSAKEGDALLTTPDKVDKLKDYFNNTKMSSEVTLSTIGQAFDKVSIPALIATSRRVLQVLRGVESTDDRDNLKYQTLHTIDDAIAENISKTSKDIVRKMKQKLDSLSSESLKDAIPSNPFGGSIKKFLTTSSIASPLPQVNPVDIMSSAMEITHMGPGGIKDIRMVRDETRQVNSSQLGIIDPVMTKENEKAGINVLATFNSFRDKQGNVYTTFTNKITGKDERLSAADMENHIIAFPNQDLTKGEALVEVLYKGKVQKMPASRVDYYVKYSNDMFSMPVNLVPFLGSITGNRALMATKHMMHSLPLKEREAPLVQVQYPFMYDTAEKRTASLFLPRAKEDGIVDKITEDEIFMKNKEGKTFSDQYETDFPLNQKTYLHTDIDVKKGDTVRKNQLLGESIYTKDKTLAIGKNLNVAYLSYKGLNINDGMVISEAASTKLTSLHMNKLSYQMDENHIVDKQKFSARFPNLYPVDMLSKIDNNGVVKKGMIINKGEPVILGMELTELTPQQSLLGQLHKKLYQPFREDVIAWEYTFPGEVVDVFVSAKRIVVSLKSEQPAQVGDKISNRSGGKGVITAIVKDSEMFQNEAGEAIDVLMSPVGIISRQNPSQLLETATAKVAKKIGTPIAVDNFSAKSNIDFVKDLMEKHGVKDKETIYDPKHDRYIKGIMTGPQYILKQSSQVEAGFSARNIGGYDSNELPGSGGKDGSKRIGMLEINSLLSHNARDILRETSALKGTKNTEFWNAYMRGLPLPALKTPFAYDKFAGMVTAAGISLNKQGSQIIAAPLTDNDIKKMSHGEVTSPYMVRAKDLRPEEGGLYDIGVTGGLSGQHWSHINLKEPVINPVMMDAVQALLGLTKNELNSKIRVQGVGQIKQELSKIKVDEEIETLKKRLPEAKGVESDKLIKKLRFLSALKSNNIKPQDAMVLTKVPVLPPIMRPLMKMKGSNDLQYSSSNRFYTDIIHNNNAIESVSGKLGDAALGDLRQTLQQSVNALVGTDISPNPKLQKQGVKGILSTLAGDTPKTGFFQSKVLTKPQDLSARGVIIPNATLSLDETAIPEDMMWKLFKPMVVKRLVQKGYPILQAQKMVDDKSAFARSEMIAESKERPILVNRNPTLHKHGIIGSYAVPTEGHSIGISPFAEKGLGADYDGDQVNIMVPVGYKAVEEAKRMTLSNILFTDKTKEKNLMIKPELETNYGLHSALNATKEGKTVSFNSYEEMKGAYKRGEISLGTPVNINK